MFRNIILLLLTLGLVVATGCRVKPTPGGTPGTLKAGGHQLSEIQVNVFADSNGTAQPIGFGVTKDDGKFVLFTPGAQGPLNLKSGDYTFTVETAGAPVFFPPEYASSATSPLKVRWTENDKALQLEVPLASAPGN